MTKAFNEGSAAQNKNVHGPKTLGDIINDMLRSDSPLAVAYRDHAATLYPDTELGVDLKLLTRQTGRMGIGQYKSGMLTRDAEDHYLFVEDATGGEAADRRAAQPVCLRGTLRQRKAQARRQALHHVQPSAPHPRVHLQALLPRRSRRTAHHSPQDRISLGERETVAACA